MKSFIVKEKTGKIIFEATEFSNKQVVCYSKEDNSVSLYNNMKDFSNYIVKCFSEYVLEYFLIPSLPKSKKEEIKEKIEEEFPLDVIFYENENHKSYFPSAVVKKGDIIINAKNYRPERPTFRYNEEEDVFECVNTFYTIPQMSFNEFIVWIKNKVS